MNILSLETSTRQLSLAISQDEKILVAKNTVLKGGLSSALIPTIEKILKTAELSLSKMHGFAIGLGPGSFTSLRVGLSTVKALSLATGKPVVGIASLDVLAFGVLKQTQSLIGTIGDARRNLAYSCFYQNKQGRLKRASDYFLVSMKDLLRKVNQETFFVGNGIPLLREEILKDTARGALVKVHFAPEEFWYPRAKHLAFLAAERFQSKKYDDADRLVPIYLYPDDCQVKQS